jgi:hypothetical protein
VAKETNRDLTKYVIKTPTAVTEPLSKRRAILALVQALNAAGPGYRAGHGRSGEQVRAHAGAKLIAPPCYQIG